MISERAWDYATYRERLRTAPQLASWPAMLAIPTEEAWPRPSCWRYAMPGTGMAPGSTSMIIALLAVLSADGVARTVLAGLPRVREAAQWVSFPAAWDDALDQVLGRLVNGSILSRSEAGAAFSLHRLVGRVVREQGEAAGRHPHVTSIAAALLEAMRIPDDEAWQRRDEGSQHVSQVSAVWTTFTGLAHAYDPSSRDLAGRLIALRNRSVGQLVLTQDLSRATAMGTAVLADSEQLLGPDHPDTLTSRHHLAHANESAGLLATAITLHGLNIADRERVLGPDHPDTLTSRHHLAHANESAGRLATAITLHGLNIADRERVLGPDHPDTLTSRHHLAHANESAGLLGKAITLNEQNIADRERVFGPDHPQTLLVRHNLATAYRAAGRVSTAITLHELNIADAEPGTWPDHPQTLAPPQRSRRCLLVGGPSPQGD